MSLGGKKSAVLTYLELKDELGMRGEGGLQAALSLRKFVSQDAVKLSVIIPEFLSLTGNYLQYDEIRNVSCCPCIVISLAGSYLRISGGNLRRSLYSTDLHRLHLSGWEPFRNGTDQVCCEGIRGRRTSSEVVKAILLQSTCSGTPQVLSPPPPLIRQIRH